ncbi:hypothetical protein MLD38_020329 [Melastoma candidum]|uniref:Uncharacterized protein n=1 Tax=Melastoma candidum TaxID=119954 RepID=A0ACB9QGC1_9MYRT|nr:hypothetical protein MLD38_020329 [Melastoma candidum]
MDSDLKKQWESQQQQRRRRQQEYESEEQQIQTPAKLPKLNSTINNNNGNNKEDHQLHSSSSAGSTLPLFVPDHPNPTQPQPQPLLLPPTKPHPSPGLWSYFSTAQWQELELQALIYRYMLSGATVPPELLHPIKKSLPHQPTSFFYDPHHQSHLQCYLHYPQPQRYRFQAGYWGNASMDPEPGRCRRTDGKKWRCSRDVVPGQKYCERHVHRGRNRSRKPVEIPPIPGTRATAPAATGNAGIVSCGYLKANPSSVTVAATGNMTTASPGHSDHSPIDLFQMNRSRSRPPPELMSQCDSSGGQVLRHFFDNWPRPLQEPNVASSTGLSISTARNSSSDVSLKLSTGDSERGGAVDGDPEKNRVQGSNWLVGWLPNQVGSMGGPLAEALRSSATMSRSSPTSVLHRMTCGLASETSLMSQL